MKKNISKGLDLLVVADPDSQSGKAKKAREIGTRVMAEAVFWSIVGVPVEWSDFTDSVFPHSPR